MSMTIISPDAPCRAPRSARAMKLSQSSFGAVCVLISAGSLKQNHAIKSHLSHQSGDGSSLRMTSLGIWCVGVVKSCEAEQRSSHSERTRSGHAARLGRATDSEQFQVAGG